jgi:hypothetical protein
MGEVIVDDMLAETVAPGTEPHVHIGRLLARRYDHLIREPLPTPMIALLVQIAYRELTQTGGSGVEDGH